MMNIDQLIKTTSKYDTPTMCNAMDVILGTRSAIGFTKSSMVTAHNSTQPIVGFAKTAKIRSSSPPLISQKEINNIRMEYYEYIVKNEENPVVVIEIRTFLTVLELFGGSLMLLYIRD